MQRASVFAILLVLLSAGCSAPSGPDAAQPTYPAEVLGGSPWSELVLEVDHAPGRAPSDAALAHLVSTMRNVTSKAKVTLVVQESLPAAAQTWTMETLLDAERATRSTTHAAPVALVHILYPAGEYNRSGVAGVTIAGTTLGPATVFLDTLRNLESDAGPLPLVPFAVERLERATLLHEVGHAFGLVNNGLAMVKAHEDAEHPGHSPNPASVMYWRVESLDGLRDYLLEDGTIPDTFDADDRADIRAAGGR